MSRFLPLAQISPGVGVMDGLLILVLLIAFLVLLLVSAVACSVQTWRLSRSGNRKKGCWLAATMVLLVSLLGITSGCIWIITPKPLPQFDKLWDFARSRPEALPHIDVWASGSRLQVQGYKWPKKATGEDEQLCGVGCCILTVHLSDGRQWTHSCREVGIDCYDNSSYIHWIQADYTPEPAPVTFVEVVREARNSLTQLNVPGDSRAWQRLAEWESMSRKSEPLEDVFIDADMGDNINFNMNFENHDGAKGGVSTPKWWPSIKFEHL